jgi:hypothetical protein
METRVQCFFTIEIKTTLGGSRVLLGMGYYWTELSLRKITKNYQMRVLTFKIAKSDFI